MNIVESLVSIILMATLVQFVVNVVKALIPESLLRYISPRVIAAALGILLCILYQLDIFGMLGFVAPELIIVSYIITGLIISAGSEAVHELIAKLRESRGGDIG